MKKTILFILSAIVSLVAVGQNTRLVKGVVFDEREVPIKGATVKVIGMTENTVTNENGVFEFSVSPYAKQVEVSCEGHVSKTAEIDGTYLIFKMKVDKEYAKRKAKEAEAKAKAEEKARKAAQREAEAKAKAEEKTRIAAQCEAKTRLATEKNAQEDADALKSVDQSVLSDPLVVNVVMETHNERVKAAASDLQATRVENTLLFDESMLEDEGATSSQSVAYLAGSSDDVFLSASSYVFSPMRFSIRGYDQRDQVTYINGIDFTDTERGRFNYSSLGGLNNATRNKDVVHGLDAPGFGYGSLSGATNINTLAADYAAGSQVGLAYTNRAYNLRAQATYATGLMNNGWAFTGSVVYRWADKGRAEGTSYSSLGYFFAAQKIWANHSLALTV